MMSIGIRTILTTLSLALLHSGCVDPGITLRKRCVEQFSVEENVAFVDVDGYCSCVMPKIAAYCDANGINLKEELDKKQFFMLAEQHPELDRYTKECMKANPPTDLAQKLVLSESSRRSLVRKYSLSLRGNDLAKTHDVEGLCKCLVDSMDGNMTVGEFIDDSFYQGPRYQNWVKSCEHSNARE